MRPTTLTLAAALVVGLTHVAAAQAPAGTVVVVPAPAPVVPGVVAPSPGTTGDSPNVTISPSGTGADTFHSNSATGGNASQPERGVPQGGGGK
ncbi:hypothetical protein OPKNFCMD_4006 [Methylobacterium crusticola]|uniref:Uncharacterized protein n=1 Tax=Methylobacterium crusticola TaxID=1697972 RepID=A0ABQ4R0X1_9HYPH|nr:hypothetical protein [Methylobacterium crusticola]GJD51253.1 hypothetical protein OPKNFCMD_4006 [Methylobacterium crusticola]